MSFIHQEVNKGSSWGEDSFLNDAVGEKADAQRTFQDQFLNLLCILGHFTRYRNTSTHLVIDLRGITERKSYILNIYYIITSIFTFLIFLINLQSITFWLQINNMYSYITLIHWIMQNKGHFFIYTFVYQIKHQRCFPNQNSPPQGQDVFNASC